MGETMALAAGRLAKAAPAATPGHTMSLWGGAIDTVIPAKPEEERQRTEAFLDKCARSGITRIFPSGGSSVLVEAAGKRGIEVHPYSSFNYHGGRPVYYTWSLNFLVPPVNS